MSSDCDPPMMPPFVQQPPRPRLSTKDRGYGGDWKRVRAIVLAEHPFCEWCGKDWSSQVHHKDHDTNNRSPENLSALCRACHMSHHARHT
jgi:5-methylcytosine-specific restriction endonuclease McrA